MQRFCIRLRCAARHFRGARDCWWAQVVCLCWGSLLGNTGSVPGSSRLNYSAKELGRDLCAVCCPPCTTVLGPVGNHWHLLGYKLFPEQPFLSLKELGWALQVLGGEVVSLWLGIWKTGCFLVRNVELFLSEVKNSPLGYYLYAYNFSFQEQIDKINTEVS